MIPYTTYTAGTPLLFLHANGYPPDCYHPLVDSLAEHKIVAMRQRPLWDNANPEELDDWHPLSDDLLRFMDERNLDEVPAVGHSMGGIALLRAALREPERFSHLILLDPVLFPPFFIRFMRIARALNLIHKVHPLIPPAQRRRRVFKNREIILRGYRKKKVFRYFSDEALEAYVKGITCPRGDGSYELCYSAEWEVQIYLTGVWRDMQLWHDLPKLKVPLLIIRGAETDTFFESAGKLVKKKLPSAKVISIPKSTHLLPLEEPKAVRDEIIKFLSA
ncbi:MAG: alpha/beta hydrolase [Anaerolineae bacterium]|jgi:pimeloyl-ACP methyl ester carboxylesterase|nr:alpha/beta hydrolase [Anaerolineae bacterium]MBT3713525.1 alpha/beta hydrolase [Anaerolineae bacterium]MBT4310850.1 alpha/beta hydrolase [Anaerolineae bacterium]MBT4458485.1 alpha/beta hydrolase [Anaerolineae bacterium]MBT4843518.1 alpha/beta hydrolase [Anaerolineae bacterium]